MEQKQPTQPSVAFIGASWLAFFTGTIAFIIGLWNADMQLNEKGYYFTVLLFGLFSAISVQKAVRDQLEGIPVTNLYYGISWFCTILSIVLLTIGLWNATLERSERAFTQCLLYLAFLLQLQYKKISGIAGLQKSKRRFSTA